VNSKQPHRTSHSQSSRPLRDVVATHNRAKADRAGYTCLAEVRGPSALVPVFHSLVNSDLFFKFSNHSRGLAFSAWQAGADMDVGGKPNPNSLAAATVAAPRAQCFVSVAAGP